MKIPIRQPRQQKATIKTVIPGPLSKALRQREDKHLAPGLQNFALLTGIAVKEARGSAITDLDGNTFIDIIGGIGVNGLGHSHPVYVQAIQAQVEKSSVGSFTSEPRAKLFEQLAEHRPAPALHRVQLYSSGAEAVESALRLAKSYTGKYEFVSFSGGFHGKTMGVLSLMGSDFKNGFGPMLPGCHIAPYADCYRCPLKLEYPSCGLACVEETRRQVKQNSTGRVAAFLVEPMQGTAGNVIPPKEFLPAIKEVAREFDALLIVDEMITGSAERVNTGALGTQESTPMWLRSGSSLVVAFRSAVLSPPIKSRAPSPGPIPRDLHRAMAEIRWRPPRRAPLSGLSMMRR